MYNVSEGHMVAMFHRASDVAQRRPRAKHNRETVGSLLWREKLPSSEDTGHAGPSVLGVRDWSVPLYLPTSTEVLCLKFNTNNFST